MDTGKDFFTKVFKHWNGIPGEVVESVSLEVLRDIWEMALRVMVYTWFSDGMMAVLGDTESLF